MAEADNPFAKWAKPADDANPFAKWEQPSVIEDVEKTAGPSLLRGTLGLLTSPGTMLDLATKGTDWAFNKVAPETAQKIAKRREELSQTDPHYQTMTAMAHRFDPLFPTYDTALKKTEEVTGPLYQAKTGVGKGVQLGLEALPSIAAGGEGIVPSLLKSAGAGAAGEGAREVAAEHKNLLPNFLQPYAEPVAQAIGMMGGTGIPAATRKVVTPLPASTEQNAAVNALRAENPNFPMTAGQATDRPLLRELEGRTGRAHDIADQQAQTFTQGVMGRAGIQGGWDNLASGDAIGRELGNIRRTNNINQQEYANLVQQAHQARADFARNYGGANTGEVDQALNLITRTTPNLNMSGTQYEYVRGQLQHAIDNASPQAANTIAGLRNALDQAFYNSVPADVANRARELGTQYANYNVVNKLPPKVGRETVTPQEVLTAVGSNWGRKAANEERGNLAPYAQNAGRVMTRIPERNTEISPITDVAGTLISAGATGAGGAAAGGLGGALQHGLEGGVLGHLSAPGIVNAAKDVASRIVNRPAVQSYLGNQRWLPGQNTQTPDINTLIRLLMSTQGH